MKTFIPARSTKEQEVSISVTGAPERQGLAFWKERVTKQSIGLGGFTQAEPSTRGAKDD